MEVLLCKDLADRLADLNQQVEFLEDLLTDPELTPTQRASIRRQILGTRETIAAVEDQLAECRGGLAILGVERTQAIQYFSINGQGSGYAPDNSVPLIALRPLVLRVYSDSPRATSSGGPVTLPLYISGRVSVDRLLSGGGVTHVADLTPMNGAIVAKQGAAIDRGNANDTLNFRLGATDCQGLLRFSITVFEQGSVVTESRALATIGASSIGRSSVEPSDAGGAAQAASSVRASASTQVYGRFDPVPALRIRPVLVRYTFGGQNLPAPTALDFATSLGFLTRTYPAARLEFGECTPMDFDEDLRVSDDKCGPGWRHLLDALDDLRNGTDDHSIIVGLLPATIMNPAVSGCGRTSGGVAAALAGRQETLAQEVGHAFGRMHPPGCGAGQVDVSYPHYYDDDRYGWSTIGEFGFDGSTSQVFSPASYHDFMGYCTPRWVSPYTYTKIRADMVERFGDPSLARRADEMSRDTLFLNFSVHRDGKVEVQPSFHLRKNVDSIETGPSTEIACELLDQDENVLVFHRCRESDVHSDADSAIVDFHAALPWFDEATSIRFLRNGDVLYVHNIEESRPHIEFSGSEIQYREERMSVEWAGQHPDRELRYMLRYSHDGGETWRALATSLRGESHPVSPRLLSGGARCLFQIVASSGIRTAVANSQPFAAPQRPRTATILSPERGMEVPEGDPIVLRGGAYSSDFGLGDMEDTVWISNLDGVLGRGLELVAERLSAGRHVITLTVSDGIDGTATAEVSVFVTARR
jgi:hypothetical protein